MTRYIIRKVIEDTLPTSSVTYPTKVVFADGSSFMPIPGDTEVTIRFNSAKAEWRNVLTGNIGFAESYRQGDIDIEGEDALRKLFTMHYGIPSEHARTHPIEAILTYLLERRLDNRDHSTALDNLNRHYNLPAEFFHYMTGELYGYTEGYYENGDESQNEAQFKKYDYICRKLRLEPGDNVVEVGSAWGTLSLMMAKRYGAQVTNYGLIENQNRVFEERIERMGLQDRVRNVVRDARELGEEAEYYDKYVSLGVLEHAGRWCLEEWIDNIARALKPGGIGVMTFVSYMMPHRTNYVINKYIWRGCYFPNLHELSQIMGERKLHVVDVENSRLMYADTMRVMQAKLNEHWESIQAIDPDIFDERFRRIWNLYYSGSSEALDSVYSDLYTLQVTFVKDRKDVYPRTRDFLYTDPFDLSDMHEYMVPLPENA